MYVYIYKYTYTYIYIYAWLFTVNDLHPNTMGCWSKSYSSKLFLHGEYMKMPVKIPFPAGTCCFISTVHWSLVTLFTVSMFWSKKDRVTSDRVCLEPHACHTKMVRPLCGRLWPYSCPKYHLCRKSRRKASFLSFEASFLKEVSQKSFVLELRSSIFEGSLAEKLGFWVWKLQFWRKSRRKASF